MLMTLAPGETFEHRHAAESTTTLVSGNVDLLVGDTRQSLVVGQPTPIAANVSHTLVNTGDEPAVIECGHRIDGAPV